MTDTNFLMEEFDPFRKENWIRRFLDFDIQSFEKMLENNDEEFWQKKGEEKALHLFRLVAQHVPAYQQFLKLHDINPDMVKTIDDFVTVPVTTRKNYLEKYSITERSWDGKFDYDILAVSGGTIGDPRLWPRGNAQEFEAAIMHELLYNSVFEVSKYRTLLIVGFPLGIYVSGIATTMPSWLISSKLGYQLTIAAVGNKRDEILNVLKQSHEHYEQIIVTGHPFFVKDLVESAQSYKIFKKNVRMKFMFSSEGFSEKWRSYLLSVSNNQFVSCDAINLYGSTDTLVTAFETPFSIFLKKQAEENAEFREKLKFPVALNVFQYNPMMRYIETDSKDNLLITSASGIPLVRFQIGDRGRVHSLSEVKSVLDSYYNLKTEGGNWEKKYWKLPLLTLFGRSDYSIEFHVAHIKPEYIHFALDDPLFYEKITGKFSMRKYYTEAMDPVLEINIELNEGQDSDVRLENDLNEKITAALRSFDYRYEFLFNSSPSIAKPRIHLWPYQHEKYFKPGLKPRYIV